MTDVPGDLPSEIKLRSEEFLPLRACLVVRVSSHLIQLLLANALCVRINQELLFCDSSNINVLLH